MNIASAIVNSLGGTVAVSNALDLAPSTVSSWKKSGKIPRWWMPQIELFAEKQNIDLPTAKCSTATNQVCPAS